MLAHQDKYVVMERVLVLELLNIVLGVLLVLVHAVVLDRFFLVMQIYHLKNAMMLLFGQQPLGLLPLSEPDQA